MANRLDLENSTHDVIVIGGGPSGSSCGYWLAKSGWDTVVLEKKQFPREKTCGDGLTPRSIKQLEDMGLGTDLGSYHRYEGLRAVAFNRELELKWPKADDLQTYGYCVTRYDLDYMVASQAVKYGALLRQKSQAESLIFEENSDKVIGVNVLGPDGNRYQLYSKVVVIADGANSRIGRSIGISRDRSYPLGLAIRGYFYSPKHDDPFIESHLDIRDEEGSVMPGYGWIFPLGDGRVNVGAGLLNTSNRWKGYNTSKLMDAFVAQISGRWKLTTDSAIAEPTGGKLPMGLTVGPRVGKGWMIVGDAGGSINPFNGEGIAYAYETGRLASTVIDEALRLYDEVSTEQFNSILRKYNMILEDNYRDYYRVASIFVEAISRPKLLKFLISNGMRSKTIMEWVLRVMANLVREEDKGFVEYALSAAEYAARVFKPNLPQTLVESPNSLKIQSLTS